jgi:hypothetical protein
MVTDIPPGEFGSQQTARLQTILKWKVSHDKLLR